MTVFQKLCSRLRVRQPLRRAVCAFTGSVSRPSGIPLADRPVGDAYRGDAAATYLAQRTGTEYWQLEQEVMRRLLGCLPDAVCVLDVPFGTGRFVPYYLEKRMTIYGLDSSPDMLAAARAELKKEYAACKTQLGDARHLPYPDAMFDLVVCFRFLSHVVALGDAIDILHEIHRVTRSCALIQLRVRRDDVPTPAAPRREQPMNHRFGMQATMALLEGAGFEVKHVERLEDRHEYFRAVFVCERGNAVH